MKKSLSLLFGILMLVIAFAFTSCKRPSGDTGNQSSNQPEHEHTYSSEWESDESSHWHSASCEHTDLTKDKSEHVWDDGAFKNDGECSPDAIFVYTCTICSRTKETSKEAHNFELVESESVSCTTDGYDFYQCSFCKKENKVIHKATGHTVSSATSSQDPTCTEDGYVSGLCDNCNTEVTLVTPATGHTELEMNFTDEYCGSIKIGDIICTICNETVSQYGHSFVKTVSNATCTKDGYIKYECQSCDYSYSEALKSPGHIEGTWQVEAASSCSAVGKKALYCIVCSSCIKEEDAPMLDHVYSSSVKDGEIIYSCTSCTHSYSVTADTTKEITFEANGGSECAPISVNSGSTLDLPLPTREGFDFAGWYYDEELSNSCSTTLTVNDDLTLYAAWNESSIESVSEEKTLYVDVPTTFEFTVVSDVELTDDNLNEYVFVSDHNGTPIEIFISSASDNKYTIASDSYEECTTYEVFILKSLSFENSSSQTMWFITDGEKETTITFLSNVKHIYESEIYSMIQQGEKVYAFLLEDKLDVGDIVAVHGATEEEILLAMEIVSEEKLDSVDGAVCYEIITADPEKVYEEASIFYSGELDISSIEFSETLEADLTTVLMNSELYAQIELANVIFASERSTKDVKFTPKEIKITPKFSVADSKIIVKYTVSSIFEKKIGDTTQEFSVTLAITNTTTFNSDVWFHWVDNFSLVLGAKNEFQIDIFATGTFSVEKDVEAFKFAFQKAKETGKWEDISKNSANSESTTKLGNVNIPLNGVTISLELASKFEFKATGEIGISVKVTTDFQFGIKNTPSRGFEFVRSFNSRVDSTFVIRGKLEVSYILELKVSVKFAGVIEVYAKVGVGPYAEASGMFVVAGGSGGGFKVNAGGAVEIGIKTELTIGASAKIETRIWRWKFTVVVFDFKHSWELSKFPIFEAGEDTIALYFENCNESVNTKAICGQTTNISSVIDRNMVFQDVDKLNTSSSEVSCKYYLYESYDGITLTPEGILSYNHTDFNHGDYIDIKVKVVYGSIYKITSVRLELCHNARNVKYTAPTCTTDGNTAYVYCYNCSCIISGENTVIPALGHSFSDEWSSDDDAHWHSATCAHTQLTEDYGNHTWDEGEITIAATCFSNGEITYTCTVCGTTKTESLDFLRHDFDENGICTICKEGSPFIFEPIDDTTCKITGVESGKELVEVIIPTDIKGYTVTSIASDAFKDQVTIRNVTIPNTVTSIGLGAFENCSRIAKLTIPFVGGSIDANTHLSYIFGGASYSDSSFVPESLNTVIITDTTTIKKQAFYNCQHIANILLPQGLNTIEEQAFENCSSLIEMNIPDTVISIGYGSFNGCSSLESLVIPFVGGKANETVASASTLFGYIFGRTSYEGGTDAYQYYLQNSYKIYCIPSSLKNVTVLGGDILYGSFSSCKSIVNISLDDNITFIGSEAFQRCTNLKNISIGNNVEIISDRAFNYCRSLVSITIPNNVTSIGEEAFYCCEALSSVTIGNSVVSIGNHAFGICDSLTNVTIGDSVTSIGEGAFSQCRSLINVSIGNSVTSIGDYAFNGCTSLINVTIGNSVTSIGDYAFSHCPKLVEVYNLSSLDITLGSIGDYGDIGRYAKIIHTSLDEKSILETIGGYSFMSWQNKYYLLGYIGEEAELILPENYKGNDYEIYQYGLCHYKNITSITIPNCVTTIGNDAFYNCSSLVSITIPDGVTTIGNYAFYNCSSLVSITIPDSVTTIGNHAFYNCSSLVSVTIPDSVTYIGGSAFSGCSSLTSISIPNDVSYIGNIAFGYCSSLTSIVLPNELKIINNGVFSSCSSLTSVTIGNNVKEIVYLAFSHCDALTSIIIPNSVTTIDSSAFFVCDSLTIYCESTSKPSDWNSNWNSQDCPVYWYSEAAPATDGNYWHYVDGKPVIWE